MKTPRQPTAPQAPAIRYRDVVASLRAKIMNGTFGAGQRLPTHVALEKQFRTTNQTVSRALAVLQQHGFIRTERRRGTFVVERPPHLHDYALVFPFEPGEASSWSRLYAGLVNVAAAFSQTGRGRILPFYGMDAGPLAPNHQHLVSLVQSQQLAGIIFATHPFMHEGSPVLEAPGIPRVALMAEAVLPQVKAVAFDESFGAKAVRYLASRGRRRIAVVTMDLHGTRRNILPLLAAHGMTTRPYWTMPIQPGVAEGARTFVELLMQARGADRPDGLIVTDDNFVEHATAGLIAAGVRIGEDLDAVVHCNFPWAGTSVVPVKRLGYDARVVLQTCLDLVDRQRRGKTVPAVTKLAALFEDELATSKMAVESAPAQRSYKR